MKTIFLYIIIWTLTPHFSCAQESQRYTFSEDYQFTKELDLYGYTFVPFEGKMSEAHYANSVEEGIVSFKINSFFITIDERANFTPAGITAEATEDKPYKLNIARIDRTSYGFEIRLMNTKNRDMQGHLKIYKNGISHVTQIKFRPTMTDAEHTYFIQPTPEDQNMLDGKFFSHQEDYDARSMEEFVDKKLYPFVSIEHHNLKDYRVAKRLYPSDDIDINFEDRMVMRGKKEKSLPCIIFKTRENKELVYLLKKAKEVQLPKSEGGRKVLEIPVKDISTMEDYYVIMHRGVKSMLKAIELQQGKTRESLLYYELRRGKRLSE
jgi:hypothetical protein